MSVTLREASMISRPEYPVACCYFCFYTHILQCIYIQKSNQIDLSIVLKLKSDTVSPCSTPAKSFISLVVKTRVLIMAYKALYNLALCYLYELISYYLPPQAFIRASLASFLFFKKVHYSSRLRPLAFLCWERSSPKGLHCLHLHFLQSFFWFPHYFPQYTKFSDHPIWKSNLFFLLCLLLFLFLFFFVFIAYLLNCAREPASEWMPNKPFQVWFPWCLLYT